MSTSAVAPVLRMIAAAVQDAADRIASLERQVDELTRQRNALVTAHDAALARILELEAGVA